MTLTRRQRQVLSVMAEGVTQDEAARRLGVSREAIRASLRRTYEALGISMTDSPYNALIRAFRILGWLKEGR